MAYLAHVSAAPFSQVPQLSSEFSPALGGGFDPNKTIPVIIDAGCDDFAPHTNTAKPKPGGGGGGGVGGAGRVAQNGNPERSTGNVRSLPLTLKLLEKGVISISKHAIYIYMCIYTYIYIYTCVCVCMHLLFHGYLFLGAVTAVPDF